MRKPVESSGHTTDADLTTTVKIGIVGGGISGLALAQRLIRAGHHVTLYEQSDRLGGLATYEDHEFFVFDRFYHVILPTDRHLISFVDDIGLSDRLRWRKTLTGFFVDKQVYSVSNAIEFLKFPPLTLWGKFRLAFTILYCSRINDWKRLENITVGDWLTRLSGRATYEKLWRPLLLAKLGNNYTRVSAVFIWTYIKRMFSARDTSASREQMGYVKGGYKTVINRLQGIIEGSGGKVELGVSVRDIRASNSRGVEIEHDRGVERFDKVIFTGPVNVLHKVVDDSLVDIEHSGENVEYLGVLCMALITNRPLTPFYVLNLADESIPFTGVIGMSNVVDSEDTGGRYLTYLPKYVLSTDPELQRPEEELRDEFLTGLRLIYPDLTDDQIVGSRIHRAFKVQPLQVLGYSSLTPRQETLHPDFFVLNTAQFVNNTLNNNEVIRAVDEFVRRHGADLDAPPRQQDVDGRRIPLRAVP